VAHLIKNGLTSRTRLPRHRHINCRLYGFAQLGVQPSPVLLEAIAMEARRQLLAFGPQVPVLHGCGFVQWVACIIQSVLWLQLAS
jgi:hypothetical protein